MYKISMARAMVDSALTAGLGVTLLAALPEHTALVAFSGLCGGIARWVGLKEKLWPDAVSTVVLGVICAVFLWPVGAPLISNFTGSLDMDPVTAVMLGGFVIGIGGVSVISLILDTIRATKAETGEGSND